MPLTPFVVERFSGLNLAVDPQEVGAEAAVDLVNADFDELGRVRTRDGYSQVKALTMTTTDALAAYESDTGLRQFVVGYSSGGNKYEAYSSTGGAAVASATPAHPYFSAVRFGTPSAQYLYLGNGSDTVWRWSGAAFTQPAGMPTALFLAVAATSNRLVAGYTAGGTSRVEFSDPGLPETWTASNFVDLTPGDESTLTGLAAWQDMVFAFKRKRFFVFSGESPDSDGLPIFNYRPVDGYGAIVSPVAGDEGVYFFDGQSVWVTSGGAPRRVSAAIEPFLRLGSLVQINGDYIDRTKYTQIRLTYSLGRLYLSLIELRDGTRRVLVYDPKLGSWTYYSTRLVLAATLTTASTDQEFTYWLANDGVNKFVGGQQVDLISTGIPWYYLSGAYDPSGENRVSVSLESAVWGQCFSPAAMSLQVANNLDLPDTGGAFAGLGSSTRQVWQQIDREGVFWQHKLSGTQWGLVSRLTHYLTSIKPAGVQ